MLSDFSGLLTLAYWTPLFYVNALVPGSSLWAGELGHAPHFGEYVIYPNLVVAAVFVIVTIAAVLFAQGDRPNDVPHDAGAIRGSRSH